MAGQTINDWYECYHPYTGRISGQTVRLKYWLQVPREVLVGQKPANGWPLLIMCPGGTAADGFYPDSSYYHPTGCTSVGVSNPNESGNIYFQYPAIRIIPLVESKSEWRDVSSSMGISYEIGNLSLTGEGFYALRSLLESILDESVIFYKDETGDSAWSNEFDYPDIDANRIYYVGYSLGNMMLFRALEHLRDYIAAAAGGGYVGLFSDIYQYMLGLPAKDDYITKLFDAVNHIPVVFYSGDYDGVNFSSPNSGVYYQLYNFSRSKNYPWYFVLLANAIHSTAYITDWEEEQNYYYGSAVNYSGNGYLCKIAHTSSPSITPQNTEYWHGPVSILHGGEGFRNPTYKFDDTNTATMQYFSTTSGKSIYEWMFSQTKQSPPSVNYWDEIVQDEYIYRLMGIDANQVIADEPCKFYYKLPIELQKGFDSILVENLPYQVNCSDRLSLVITEDGRVKKVYVDGTEEPICLGMKWTTDGLTVKVRKM